MAIETINIGTSPNDGTGDPLRVAFDKTNDNFLTITADGGNEITVLNPTTATDTDLNVALQDILDAGGGGAVDSVNGQTGVVSIDLESVLTEGNRPIKRLEDFAPYEFIAEDKGKLLINADGESATLNADIFTNGDTLLIIPEVSDIQLIAGVGVTIKGNSTTSSDHILRLGEMAVITKTDGLNYFWLNIIPQITSQTIQQTTSFTAEVDLRYTANGTLTVTDPTPIANKGFIVHVIGGSVTIGGSSYTTGDLVYRYYDGASWISTNMNASAGVGATQNARATRLELTSDINLPISVTGSVSVVDFDNTVFNVDPTVFTNNGAGTITCTLAGNYLVTTSIVLESPLASAITKSELGIRKNGTNIICATTDDTPIALGNNIRSLTTSTIINLSANDTLQAVVNLFGASATGRGLRLPSLFGTTATQVSNISIERLEVSEFDVDATPTDGSSNAVSSNGVFDALALKQDKSSFLYAEPSSITGVVIETNIQTLLIPANTISASDAYTLTIPTFKSVTATNLTYSVYLGATSGARTTLIGNFIAASGTRAAVFQRFLNFSSGNLYCSTAFSTNHNNPFTLTSGNLSGQTTTFDITIDNYITISANPSVVTEVIQILDMTLTPR